MKIGDLVTLSARGWKLEYPKQWVTRKLRAAGKPVGRIWSDYDENRKEVQRSCVGMVLREGSTGTIVVKWLADEGPPGPWSHWAKSHATSLWERGHLKFVSKGKRAA